MLLALVLAVVTGATTTGIAMTAHGRPRLRPRIKSTELGQRQKLRLIKAMCALRPELALMSVYECTGSDCA
jgi:hypothetical protein